MLWRTGYHYFINLFNKAWTQILCKFKSWSRRVRDLRWWESLAMVPARLTLHKKRNFLLRISSVNVTKSAAKLWIWSHLLNKSLIENFIFRQCKRLFSVNHLAKTIHDHHHHHQNESAKLHALRAKNVLTCPRDSLPYVLTFQCTLRAYVPSVLTCQNASFDATIFSFSAIVAEVVHIAGKVWV